MGNYILDEAFKELRNINEDIVRKPNTTKVLGKKVFESKKTSELTQKSTLNKKLSNSTNETLKEENKAQKTSDKPIVEGIKPCASILSLEIKAKKKDIDESNICVSRRLKEEKINLLDNKDVEKGKELLKQEEDETVEKIVDVNADEVGDIKKSYIGDLILQCNVCNTLVYKEQDKLVRDENDESLYNIEDECPKCGSKDGYKLIGVVSAVDSQSSKEIEKEQEGNDEVKTDSEESAKDEDNKVNLEPSTENKEDKDKEDKEETFESLDKDSFSKLVCNYGNKIYENFSKFEVSKVTENKNNIIVEGIVTFKDNKTKNITFNLDNRKLNENRCKLIGECKYFSNVNKAFIFNCNVNNSKIVCENLSYRYLAKNKLNESVKVIGKVIL